MTERGSEEVTREIAVLTRLLFVHLSQAGTELLSAIHPRRCVQKYLSFLSRLIFYGCGTVEHASVKTASCMILMHITFHELQLMHVFW